MLNVPLLYDVLWQRENGFDDQCFSRVGSNDSRFKIYSLKVVIPFDINVDEAFIIGKNNEKFLILTLFFLHIDVTCFVNNEFVGIFAQTPSDF